VGTIGFVSKELLKNADCSQPVLAVVLSLRALRERPNEERRYRRISPFPTVQRDLAFIVDSGVAVESVRSCIEHACGAILHGVRLFDLFSHSSLGEGKKSCAFRLTFGSSERTLTDAEVDVEIQAGIRAVQQEFDARLRA
jgi:phenylalanyl-tRNA synthetase beta chain